MKYIEKYSSYSEISKRSHIFSKCEDGTYACDCIGWTRHYPRIDCRHILEVIYNHPEPLDLDNWDKLQGRKEKVKRALDLFRKTSATSITTDLEK